FLIFTGQHLVLISDPEKGESVFAFDNPGFKEGPSIVPNEKESNNKLKWPHWNSMGLLRSSSDKVKAMDDSYTAQPPLTIVPLRSHDFTGLGFNICGNMRDGIYIKDVLHRGPASESGRITSGDRIDSIKINLRHVVFEDALTILSYASPYEVELAIERSGQNTSTLLRTPPPPHKICHPFYRSHSISDLQQIGKVNRKQGDQPSSLLSDVSLSDSGKPTTLDRKSRSIEHEKTQNSRNCMLETVQKHESIFHEIDLEVVEPEKSKDSSPSNVKSYLVKGIQNLKEKLHNSLHMEDPHKEEVKEVKDVKEIKEIKDTKDAKETKEFSTVPTSGKIIVGDGFVTADLIVPEVVEKAGTAAKESRKSSIVTDAHDEVDNKYSLDIEDPIAAKRNKRKAPMPPQDAEDEHESLHSVHSESDSEAGDTCGTIELNSTHITVHQVPQDNESRKASSLGDLSRYEADSVVLLERAVSLDLGDGAPGCKKRKAPLPPQDDCVSPQKEARLDNGIAGTLKKSSVWGTLEEIIQNGSESETDLGISGCSTPEKGELVSSTPFKYENSDGDILLTLDQLNDEDTPPELPTSPVPTYSFITEIQVPSERQPTNDVVHFDSTEQFLDHMATLKAQEVSPILTKHFQSSQISPEKINEYETSPQFERIITTNHKTVMPDDSSLNIQMTFTQSKQISKITNNDNTSQNDDCDETEEIKPDMTSSKIEMTGKITDSSFPGNTEKLLDHLVQETIFQPQETCSLISKSPLKKAPVKPPKQNNNCENTEYFLKQMIEAEIRESSPPESPQKSIAEKVNDKLHDQISKLQETSLASDKKPTTSQRDSFSKENMSDEQILALKASPSQRAEIAKPTRSNVTITTIKSTTPSRIPVRAGHKSPRASLSPTSDKRSMIHRNGHSSP
ncbi:uncharacterized protein LOC106667881, partial [Cimex lectularius]|uniref:PDZ domain-containing protein n=1 Tax=Cimex lectularius TaxID=79782 RepID=A0A8I6TK91_CIMLE